MYLGLKNRKEKRSCDVIYLSFYMLPILVNVTFTAPKCIFLHAYLMSLSPGGLMREIRQTERLCTGCRYSRRSQILSQMALCARSRKFCTANNGYIGRHYWCRAKRCYDRASRLKAGLDWPRNGPPWKCGSEPVTAISCYKIYTF
jgi:hypothetical protein